MPTASSLEVTPGSGLKLATGSYTESAVTVHDQKVIFGESGNLPSYTYAGAISTATLNSHLVQIMAGASLRVRIRRIEVWQRTLATTAAFMSLGVYRLTTAGTGGSAIGLNPLDPAAAGAGATAMQLPTAKGTEGALMTAGSVYMMQTAGASSTVVSPMIVWDFDRLRCEPLIIAAGATNGIALKTNTAVAAGFVDVMIWLTESTF